MTRVRRRLSEQTALAEILISTSSCIKASLTYSILPPISVLSKQRFQMLRPVLRKLSSNSIVVKIPSVGRGVAQMLQVLEEGLDSESKLNGLLCAIFAFLPRPSVYVHVLTSVIVQDYMDCELKLQGGYPVVEFIE